MKGLFFATLVASLSLFGCVGDDTSGTPDAGQDVTTSDAPGSDAPADAPADGPTCNGVDFQTDDSNCGSCGHACGTGSTCSSGFCTPVLMCNAGSINPNNTAQIALLKGVAYIESLKQVLACNLGVTNANASTFFSTTLNGFAITSLTGDANHFYFANHNTLNNSNALTSADGTQADTAFVMTYPSSWTSSYLRTDDDPSTGKLFASLTTEAELLELDQATDAGVPTQTCVSNISTLVSAAAGGGRFVYADSFTKKIAAVTVTGDTCSSPATIAGGVTSPAAVAVAASTVAFADGNGNVYACDAALGCTPQVPPTPLVTGQNGVVAIALDSATPPNLYWIGSAGLAKCSSSATACNGKPTILVPNATPTVGLAVDATDVYYLQGGALNRVAK